MTDKAADHPLPGGEAAHGGESVSFDATRSAFDIERPDGGGLGWHVADIATAAEDAVERVLRNRQRMERDHLRRLFEVLLDSRHW